jgi:glycosyltransferase involved in cell wall biosynthesis
MISICAVISVRNEAYHLQFLLPALANQGIDVVIIDNDSTDETPRLLREYNKSPVLRVERVPFRGYFSLQELLEAEQQTIQSLPHDWVIHHDADEIMESSMEGCSLRDAIQEAHDNGFNAVNFEEFVFLPPVDSDFFGKDYHRGILQYYFFEPKKNRLNRAWRRDSNLSNILGAGHNLAGSDLSVFPVNHILRHYIVLSYEHAKQKYLTRIFSQEEIRRGWHKNRLSVNEVNLSLPADGNYLFNLDLYNSKDFQRKTPALKHYWEW